MGIIYRPVGQKMTPNKTPIIPTEDNDFIVTLDCVSCIAYRFHAYNSSNTRLAPPSTDRIENASTLYNGEELIIPVSGGSFTAGDEYKWQVVLYGNDIEVASINTTSNIITTALNHNLSTGDIVYVQSTTTIPTGISAFTTYYIRKLSPTTLALYLTSEAARSDGTKVDITSTGAGIITISNIAISEQIPFTAYSEPSVTLPTSTIAYQSVTLNPVYYQAEGIPVEKFDVVVTDQNGVELASQYDNYTSNLQIIIDGLIDGNEINVEYTVTNQAGQVATTGIVNFPISYTTSTVDIVPSVTNLPNESAILVQLSEVNTSLGSVSGTSSYYTDFIEIGNDALTLNSGAILSVNSLSINSNNTFCVIWKPTNYATFNGNIFKLSDTVSGNYITVGFDVTLGRFYRIINGTTFYNSPNALVSGQVYLLAVNSTNLYTIDYATI